VFTRLWTIFSVASEDGDEADCEFDCDGVGCGPARPVTSVQAGHRERKQDRRGAGDGAEHGAQGDQDDDGARGAADSWRGGDCPLGGRVDEVRDAV